MAALYFVRLVPVDAPTAPEGTAVTMLYVEARANVLGMRYGERAILDSTTFELTACIERGLVALVGPDGAVPDPPPVIRRPCGCGGN